MDSTRPIFSRYFFHFRFHLTHFRSIIFLIQTVDLVEAQNLAQVQTTLYKMGGQAQKVGFSGPVIGVKQADANKREFSQEQLEAGKNVIGLQVNYPSDCLKHRWKLRSYWLIIILDGFKSTSLSKGNDRLWTWSPNYQLESAWVINANACALIHLHKKRLFFYYTSTCLYCTFFKFFTTQKNQTVKPKTRTHVMFYYVIMTP